MENYPVALSSHSICLMLTMTSDHDTAYKRMKTRDYKTLRDRVNIILKDPGDYSGGYLHELVNDETLDNIAYLSSFLRTAGNDKDKATAIFRELRIKGIRKLSREMENSGVPELENKKIHVGGADPFYIFYLNRLFLRVKTAPMLVMTGSYGKGFGKSLLEQDNTQVFCLKEESDKKLNADNYNAHVQKLLKIAKNAVN